ncbi:AraC family transcriptional regulator [Pedobacter sp. MC2016-15]|uniref:helix-turn-helix domain-containing protein n=1 Tax=Pedobacter sp. MC2016-15 TaxID=2994473 RepID=UPI002245C490|nr:AraC family transcriptional regulator [Pedobacter sp. MC2016-15]MCX2480298.1 AraC family transcriptional regulator [Pedobacter sp. MC2016-15]
MTQSGEVITLNGENSTHLFSLNRGTSLQHSDSHSSFSSITAALSRASRNYCMHMIFILKGRVNGYLPGSRKAAVTFSEKQHNILLINEKLSLQVKTEEHEVMFISMDHSFLSGYLPAEHSGYQNLRNGIDQDEPAVFSASNLHITPEISSILQALKTSPHTGFCEKLFLESKILELLVLQISQFELLKDNTPSLQLKKEELQKMYEVKEILTEDLTQQISLRSLAHRVGTNEFNLKRNFKLAFGTTVFGYLNQYKMDWAKRMLIEKDITIAEVSEKTGYKYATHFSSAFKKYFGYLPNQIKSGKLSLLIFIEDFVAIFENLEMIFGLG